MDSMKNEMLQSIVNCMKQAGSYDKKFCSPEEIVEFGKTALRLAKAFRIVAIVEEVENDG